MYANCIFYVFFVYSCTITCAFMHCVQVLCQRKNSRQLLVPSEKEVLGFWHQGAAQRVPAKLQRPPFQVTVHTWLFVWFLFFFLFMWAQFRVGTCVSFQNNVCTWVQEWFFSGRWSFPYLLERSFFSSGLLHGSTELLCPRRACKNSSHYSAPRCPRH